jgi:hypothetical protein
MSTEHLWNDSDRGKLKYSLSICPSATLPTTNPALTGLAWNQNLQSERLATYRLSHDTALKQSLLIPLLEQGCPICPHANFVLQIDFLCQPK